MDGFIDTLMNLLVFAFIGLLFWLYFKPSGSQRHRQKDVSPEDD